jgi:hypothetical protein
MLEYAVNAPSWADGAQKRRWLALPGAQTIGFHPTEAFELPVGTALVQHLTLPVSPTTTRRIETRVLLRQIDRWAGFTYRWNSGQTDATLLADGLTENIPTNFGSPGFQTWRYPSPAECLGCHSAPERRVLGLRTRQLHRDFAYPLATDDQLHAWNCIDLFAPELVDPESYGAYAEPGDATQSVQRRSRSYLAANCAPCHQPGAPMAVMDLRYRMLLGELDAIGVPPTEGTLGLPNALRIRPGVKAQSVLWHRVQTAVAAQRMPKGSLLADPLAVQLLGTWIDTGLSVLDSDEDSYPDATDNCPSTPNNQSDMGGVLTSSPDGNGDACQCLDATLNGRVLAEDVPVLRNALAGLSALPAAAHRLCTHPDSIGRCSIADVTRLRRVVMGRPPAISQTCAAATEPL